MDLNFTLHPGQVAITNSDALYKVCAAGRRFGKTVLAAILCIIEGLKEVNVRGHALDTDAEVMYMAPTFEQAKGIFWPVLKRLAEPVTLSAHENTGVLTLINGVRIRLKGMDNPDRARGFKLRFAVLDEYADMHAGAWDAIIQPALMDVEGGALFIGTPKGKNHFYDLFRVALECKPDEDGFMEWEAFKFNSMDNPFLAKNALKRMYENENYSSDLRAQELEADFLAGGSNLLKAEWWKYSTQCPSDGYWVVTCDLQGFENDRIQNKRILADESVISIVKITRSGWWVKKQVAGQWNTRETALQIILAARSVQATVIGIERGALMNAVLPYMDDVMAEYRNFFQIEPLSHGNQQKELRVQWALQGRLEKGRITLNCDPDLPKWERPEWVNKLVEDSSDFPSKSTPDDRPDSLAYVDQVARTIYFDASEYVTGPNQVDEWEPLDEWAGV
jgi:hypothetical protein